MADFEVTVIGAGIVGLAIAARLSGQHQNILLLEKNAKYGMETSSRNSEVIHAGIYYTPGSLRATLCVEGRDELYALCKKQGIPYRQTAKIITATNNEEQDRLHQIYQNGLKNGVTLELLDAAATLKLEPNIQTVGSIFSPLSGIVSAHGLMDYYYHAAVNNGVTVQLHCEILGVEQSSAGYTLAVDEAGRRSSFTSEKVVNAAGLQSDLVAAMAGIDIDTANYRQLYGKGSYFAVTPSKAKLVSRLIYPVPRNETLGVHGLLDLGGRLKFGPDIEYLPGRDLDYSVSEQRRTAFGESVRRIVPGISDDDLVPDMAGIRPKLQRKGEPPRDFVIVHEKERGLEGFVNLIGIESPGLTASPAIARYVEGLLE